MSIFRGKKVLVAGGSGFVGTNLILRLLEMEVDIYATIHNKPAQIHNEKVHWIKADLLDRKQCWKITEGMDYVFMCAAVTSGAAVLERTPLAHVSPSVIMNTNMLEAAYKADIKKFLFISSSTIYPLFECPLKEEDAFAGDVFDKYFCVGWTNRFAEIQCQMYAEKIKNPMKVVVVRASSLYGEYDDFEWETSHVLPALIRKTVERKEPIEVWGDGKDIKDFIYIKDFIDGIMLVMEKVDSFIPINIAKGESISVEEALHVILKADKYTKANIVFNSNQPSMVPVRRIDVSKAKKMLGFEARTSFYEGIANTIKWYREKIERTT